MLINEIPHNFKVLQDTPIDSRYKISSIENLDTEIPLGVRYQGLMVWVTNLNAFFIFKNGIQKSNFVAYNQNDILVINSISDIAVIPMNVRYQGQLVFIKNLREFYAFRNGIDNVNLISISNDIIIIQDKIEIPNIPTVSRFHGRLFYITNDNALYSFIDPLGNSDILLVNGSDKTYHIINSIDEFSNIPDYQLGDGVLIYVLDSQLVYVLRGGIKLEHLQIFQNIISVSKYNDLDAITFAAHGTLAWVDEYSRFFRCNIIENEDDEEDDITYYWDDFNQDIVSITNETDMNLLISDSIFRPQFIIRHDLNETYYWNGMDYIPIILHSTPVFNTITEVMELPDNLKITGRLYFIRDANTHYTFTKSITNDHFLPINRNNIVSNLNSIDTELPLWERRVGDIFYNTSTKQLYYFVSPTVWNRLSSISEFIDTIIISNSIPLIINHSLNSQMLNIEIYDYENDKVYMDWIYGKSIEDDDINSLNNHITLMSQVPGEYILKIKAN